MSLLTLIAVLYGSLVLTDITAASWKQSSPLTQIANVGTLVGALGAVVLFVFVWSSSK